MDDVTYEDVVRAADGLAEDVLAAANVTEPPVDAVRLAERHFGLGKYLVTSDARGRCMRNQACTPEDRQWAAARAIGWHLQAQLLETLGIAPDGLRPPGTSPANLLAVRLLLPGCWFGDDARACRYDLTELQRLYAGVPAETIAWRMLDLKDSCIVSIIENGTLTRRRCNVRPVPRELSPAERECQQYVSYYSRPRRMRQDGWTVDGWPLHQPDWKKEILRSVVDEDE